MSWLLLIALLWTSRLYHFNTLNIHWQIIIPERLYLILSPEAWDSSPQPHLIFCMNVSLLFWVERTNVTLNFCYILGFSTDIIILSFPSRVKWFNFSDYKNTKCLLFKKNYLFLYEILISLGALYFYSPDQAILLVIGLYLCCFS